MRRITELAAALLIAAAPAAAFGFQERAPGNTQEPGRRPGAANPGAAGRQEPGAQAPRAPARQLPGQAGEPGAQAGREGRLDDRMFAVVAAESGIAEIAASQLALERASSEEVKRFAQQMIEDHTRANRDLMSAAQAIQAPTQRALSPAKQAELTILASKQGEEFDRAYADQQLAAHICAVALFRAESEQGQSAELKEFAAQTLPRLQEHLQMVQRLPNSVTQGQGAGHGQDAAPGAARPATPTDADRP